MCLFINWHSKRTLTSIKVGMLLYLRGSMKSLVVSLMTSLVHESVLLLWLHRDAETTLGCFLRLKPMENYTWYWAQAKIWYILTYSSMPTVLVQIHGTGKNSLASGKSCYFRSRCPSTNRKWCCSIYTMEFYSAMKKNEMAVFREMYTMYIQCIQWRAAC